ncbi:hypothetical protein DACRYDRAFT_107520 [Dacryopinax primogenitus]|uniref:Sacsin/Nov domain-containing protein n=1 Tax=Dacryopinax primogenitus (strain DJM 731) TaxID=1858805 RepID=M5FZ48_DACPD|nr:uncharacterized protein DACRYDRAFT_107520 [Dacryopinax primogenitus]EJU01784.1 hypothetical protein DACRYDRAFT_107520 [Dacryopinax primogenitus]
MAGRESLWENGRDEQVEVNQRALIDKVLARYSGEFTVFRELLQNADDAQATRAEIRFDTKAYMENSSLEVLADRLPNLKKDVVYQWTFKNDGMVFKEEDWNRLKKIAEGNPDEEKIGAFGVGFYSLFSVTDQPFVKSGSSWMGFYWRDGGDQLFVRRGELPNPEPPAASDGNPWTSFEMSLREPGPLPAPPIEIARFLATSLTFMNRLRDVSVYWNEKRLVRIVKELDTPRNLGVPGQLSGASPGKMMTIRGIDQTAFRMKASILRWVYTTGVAKPIISIPTPSQSNERGFFSAFFSRKQHTPTPPPVPTPAIQSEPDPFTEIESNVALNVYSAHVDVKMDRKLLQELERATKKKPSSKTVYHLIYTSKEDYDASAKEDLREFQATGSVFRSLRADMEHTGLAKVFIGQPTAQTTGVAGHMAARFIPTVERESVDLVDRHVSQWNKELLFVGGYLCRAVWEFKMSDIGRLWNENTDSTYRADLVQKCLHVMKFFSVYRAAPSSIFSDYIEAAFFACARNRTIPLLSTAGVLTRDKIRLPRHEFSGFLQQLPVIPEAIMDGVPNLMDTLTERGLVRDINFEDVLTELRSRPLSETEMINCLKWRINLNTDGVSHSADLKRQFLGAAVVTLPGATQGQGTVISLSEINNYLNPRGQFNIPTDVPLPRETLPYSISKFLTIDRLTHLFGWTELKLTDWVRFISSPDREVETNISLSPAFAERVLTIAVRGWQTMPDNIRTSITESLQQTSCIHTTKGMQKPTEAYFPTAHIFEDLPVIEFSKNAPTSRSNLEKLLLALGVRKHVDLQLVFSKMVTTGDWDIARLVEYLVAVKDMLSVEEKTRLRQTAAFPQEGQGALSKTRHLAQDLYVPDEALRQLKLPILDWKPKWKPHSEEAKFLTNVLGLKRHPPIETILELAAGEQPRAQAAFDYYLQHFDDVYAKKANGKVMESWAFVPAIHPDGSKHRSKPTEVFSKSEASIFGFSILDPAYQGSVHKLKISEQPPMEMVVARLIRNPPKSAPGAVAMFEYMSNRLAELGSGDLARLSDSAVVPYIEQKGSDMKLTMLKPTDCYFASSSQASGQFSELFHFVDFGTRANAFLRQCGVKSEPTVQEIAKFLVTNPRRFYQSSGGAERYLGILRNMAANRHLLPVRTRNELKKSAFLLCTRRQSSTSPKKSKFEDEDEDVVFSYELRKAEEIVIVDDASSYATFSVHLYGAPQEDTLEAFYEQLGSQRLSQLVSESYKPQGAADRSQFAQKTRALILERLPLFLHEHLASESRLKLVIKPEWLENDANFRVLSVRGLRLTRQLQWNNMRYDHTTEASAGGNRQGRSGPVTMWVSTSDSLDWFEVANVLCNILFQAHGVNDSLLLSTLLSTELRALKRRGYAVNRILQQQKAREDAIQAQEREHRLQAESSGLEPQQDSKQIESVANGSFLNSFNKLKDRLQGRDVSQGPSKPPSITAGPSGGSLESARPPPPPYPGQQTEFLDDEGAMPGSMPAPVMPPRLGQVSGGRVPRPEQHVTPISNIEANLNQALAACRPERGNLLHNRQEMSEVREALDEGYCDASGAVGDMIYVGNVESHRFYTKGVNDPKAIFSSKQQSLQRFSSAVIFLMGEIYGVPQTSLHIFFDLDGPLIAFNRNGSIFLNLRYYEAWHDADVQRGELGKALISWYFTLAHEIAHNLVQPHNSEHEFYFSSLCEAKLPALAGLIARL